MIEGVKIREVAVRRKFNLGNYETMDIEMVATVNEGQDADEVVKLVDERIIKLGGQRKAAGI